MEAIHSVAHLIQQGYYMLKSDLWDAYYSVKMLEEHVKYLIFFARSKLLNFVLLPNGLPSESRKLTNLTKPLVSVLRSEGIIVARWPYNIRGEIWEMSYREH